MLKQKISQALKRLMNFLAFAKNYLRRKNPLKTFFEQVIASLKDMFSINKKKKIAQYRLSYQMYKLKQMESLIAQNNDHTFLKGKRFNEMR